MVLLWQSVVERERVPGAHVDLCDLEGVGSSGVVRAAVEAKGRVPS